MAPNERYQQLKELFQAALERTDDERAAFLDAACQAEPSLRAELDELFAAHEQTSYFDAAALAADDTTRPLDAASEFVAGKRIGPYKILRELGHGGMGTVYLAVRDDDQFKKRVALKLVRGEPLRPVLDSDLIVRRFRQERQILAGLEHPNIARLLDGGATEEGLPYLVLEYVEGQPLDDYCDGQQLGVPERLQLFRAVCGAVHYAHQNLVVHRDLKPSNILVAADGTPKLLDFGIAKILNPEIFDQTIDPTLTAVRLMTPGYASPEQVRGETITTASDVYTLGVILYELLTGHRPYQVAAHSLHDMARVICEVEPPKPSSVVARVEVVRGSDGSARETITPEQVSHARNESPEKLRRRLAGDLDNILLMALRKEPERRYASVERFSEDLRHYLDELPVAASRATFAYRSAKFVRRHKAGVAAAALVALSLVAGIITTYWQARVARSERARAERRFNDVRKLAHAVVFDYHDAVSDLPGSTPVRQRMVKDALAYLDSLAREVSSDRDLQRELGTAYRKIGDIQGNSYFANLGDAPGALTSYRKALSIRQALAAAAPNELESQRDLAEIHERIGDVLWDNNEVKQTYEHYLQDSSLLEQLSAAAPDNINLKMRLANIYAKIGDLKGAPTWPNLGDTAGALEFQHKAQVLREAIAAADPANRDKLLGVLLGQHALADLMTSLGDLNGAEQQAQQALANAHALLLSDPKSVKSLRVLSLSQLLLGDVLFEKGETSEALKNAQQSLAISEKQAQADPTNAQLRHDLIDAHYRMGKVLKALGDLANAQAHQRQALALAEAGVAAEPGNKLARNYLANCHLLIGQTLTQSGNLSAALQSLRRALVMREELDREDASNSQAKLNLAEVRESMADLLLKSRDAAGALTSYRQAAELIEGYLAGNPAYEVARGKLATIYFKLGQAAAGLAVNAQSPLGQPPANWRAARQWYQRSLDLYLAQKNKGVLKSEHATKPDEIARQLARCDEVLSKFNK